MLWSKRISSFATRARGTRYLSPQLRRSTGYWLKPLRAISYRGMRDFLCPYRLTVRYASQLLTTNDTHRTRRKAGSVSPMKL